MPCSAFRPNLKIGTLDSLGSGESTSRVDHREDAMNCRRTASAVALVLGLSGAAEAQIFDPARYPDIAGRWSESGVNQWARGEKPPLTPEYQAIFNANV